MTTAAVAHGDKRLGDADVGVLRRRLEERGVDELRVVGRAKDVTDQVAELVADGYERVLAWGGDGTVRRAVHGLCRDGAPADVVLGILPAGTANVLARHLGVPLELDAALDVALGPDTTRIDVGEVQVGPRVVGADDASSGPKHFDVALGLGIDAEVVATMDESLVKDVLGRFGHLAALAVELPAPPARFAVGIDGEDWFEGEASSVMVSNLPDSVAGMRAFPDADPTDGRFDVGVVLARSRREWMAVVSAVARGREIPPELARRTTAERITIGVDRPTRWQVDGSDRRPTASLDVRCLPAAVRVAAPA